MTQERKEQLRGRYEYLTRQKESLASAKARDVAEVKQKLAEIEEAYKKEALLLEERVTVEVRNECDHTQPDGKPAYHTDFYKTCAICGKILPNTTINATATPSGLFTDSVEECWPKDVEYNVLTGKFEFKDAPKKKYGITMPDLSSTWKVYTSGDATNFNIPFFDTSKEDTGEKK